MPLLADTIRVLAIEAHVNTSDSVSVSSAWLIDCDSLWLRAWNGKQHPAVDGHLFGSMAASPSAVRGTTENRERHWRLNFLKSPGDKCYIATPCRFAARSPVITKLKEWCSETILGFKGGTLAYNVFMFQLRLVVRSYGLEQAICCPIAFSSIPYHSKDAALKQALHSSWNKEPHV